MKEILTQLFGDAVKSHYFNLFRQDLAKEENKGKSAVDILHNLTKDDATAFTGVTAVKLAGGRPMGAGGDIDDATARSVMGLPAK